MCRILIFGGTTEGRLLGEFCDREQIYAYISVTTKYGKELIPESEYLTVRDKAMDRQQMELFIKENRIHLVVDATHPYAREATDNIRVACLNAGVRRLRCVREIEKNMFTDVTYVKSVEEAASFLKKTEGKVLVTTGSKELAAFAKDQELAGRIYARVLPTVEVLNKCADLGFEKNHIIAMQGPFSEELNAAMLRQIHASFLVTKETGAIGGYGEKIRGARSCGVRSIVISCEREQEETDLSEVCCALKEFAGPNSGQISCILAGIGPGHRSQMTEAVIHEICEGDVIFGAPRVLEAARKVRETFGGKAPIWAPFYLPEDIEAWFHTAKRKGIQKAVLLFSGDTGFYSGAEKMTKLLTEKKIPYSVLPGISSVSYLASKLGINWNEAEIDTAHGREFDPVKALLQGSGKLFVLAGGKNGAARLCQMLCEGGFTRVSVTVGENLSYPEERIVTGMAEDFKGKTFESLCLVLIDRGEN